MLVSPLTPQQVAGAFDRLGDPSWDSERDPILGLPLVAGGEARHGFPCHRIAVTPVASDDPWEVALLLRRALRGYDRLGADADGGLAVLLYCRDEHLGRTLARLETVLAGRVRLAAVASQRAAEQRRAA